MSGGTPEYPPQFADSVVSSIIGQINDLSGSEPETTSSPSANIDLKRGSAFAGALEDIRPIPVFITGSRAPSNNHFPGLREAVIGSAIIQLADQIPDDSAELLRIKEEIIRVAEKLHRAGATKILQGTIRRKPSIRKKTKS